MSNSIDSSPRRLRSSGLSRENSGESITPRRTQKSQSRTSSRTTRKDSFSPLKGTATIITPPIIELKNQFVDFKPTDATSKKILAIKTIIDRDTTLVERMYILNQVSNQFTEEKKELGRVSILKIFDKIDNHFGPRNSWVLANTPFIVDLIGSGLGISSTIEMIKRYIKMICKMRNSIIQKLGINTKQIYGLNKALKNMVKDIVAEIFIDTPYIIDHLKPDGKKFVMDRILDSIFLTDDFCGEAHSFM